jgi:type III pantothenate kinase
MILTIDVGNTDTVFAFYSEEKLLHNFRVPTKPYRGFQEYKLLLERFKRDVSDEIEGAIIANVVPDLRENLKKSCKEIFSADVSFVKDQDIEIDLKAQIDKPETLGADRIANAVGAIKKYQKNIIIADFGTATTFEIIGDDRNYLGGAIAPGIATSVKSLHESAALLPMYDVERPKKVIATTLEDALHSGIFYGSLGMINFLIENIKQELSCDFKVISTGGLGGLFTKYTDSIEIYEPNLTTFGLLEIYRFNNKGSDV